MQSASLPASTNWEEIAQPLASPNGARSARILLYATCSLLNSCSVNYDDVSLSQASATAVRRRSFTATRSRAETLLR